MQTIENNDKCREGCRERTGPGDDDEGRVRQRGYDECLCGSEGTDEEGLILRWGTDERRRVQDGGRKGEARGDEGLEDRVGEGRREGLG